MIAETGHYALILGLAVAIVQTVLPLWGTAISSRTVPIACGSISIHSCGSSGSVPW